MILRDDSVLLEEPMSISSASGTASPASSNAMMEESITDLHGPGSARSRSVGERFKDRKRLTPRTVCQSAKTSREMQSALMQRNKVYEEAAKLSEEKTKVVSKGSDDQRWRDSIRQQMEAELDQRVRDALETPPPERHKRQQSADVCKNNNNNNKYSTDIESLNAHVLLDLSDKERAYLKSRRWKALQAKRQLQKYHSMNYAQPPPATSRIEVVFRDELSKSNQDEFPGVFGLNSFSEGVKDLNEIHRKQFEKYTPLRTLHKQYYTKEGYLSASRTGRFPDGTALDRSSEGSYEDKFGVVRDRHGPFWPSDWGPLYPHPKFLWKTSIPVEPLYYFFKNHNYPTVESQLTPYMQKWRGVLIVYDSERSSRDHYPSPVPEGCCPNLLFESRFESGNLRQARRVGQFEYELVLKTDLYTTRHTQWYYFRVQNAVPGVTYKFRIVNLLKRDSLYNYGMRPLVYSEVDAKNKNVGWLRTGHHISYSRNVMHLHCPLLNRGIPFYELEWQMEFPNENDTYYLAHCYPYTFTDLKDDLECLLNDKERQGHIQREVLCETRAGNSCFLVTVTNFDQDEEEQDEKKAVIITARVHPGESQASWMMKGVLDFITGHDPVAVTLRDQFIFKIVPMLNPDGVIVGNYRCSLAARDLNRNYRHPRKESFPTVWHTKNMIENVLEKNEVVLYCDLHGHSRKHNVFMYGNNTATDDPDGNNNNNNNGASSVNTRAYLFERLFPWLMAQKSPEKFSFPFCKFNIKRCKEATGRVVMWRQMRILNSFTLEATFSGTAMNKDECRHFNIADYMEMGRVLCQSVLEYKYAQENKARQTEIVLEMTRFLACQVLERRNRNFRMPNLRAFMRSERANKLENGQEAQTNTSQHEAPIDEDTPQDEDLDRILIATLESAVTQDDRMKRPRDKRLENGRNVNANLSKSQVNNMIDAESIKTMDGCLKILAQLNVSEALEESDSSDSDSESEPELKPAPEPKMKKKKRKSKKQRDKEQQDRKGGSGGSDKKEERKNSALPTISGNPASDNRSDGSSQSKPQASRKELTEKQKADARFVSKYEGRKNGGIPCFAEERSVERAAKRMAEMKKRSEEEKQRELAFFMKECLYSSQSAPPSLIAPGGHQIPMPHVQVKCVDDAGVCQCGPNPRGGMPVLRRSLTNDELQRRLQVALNEGTPNIAQTLVGFNVRTGYTHADSFRDLAPSVLPATAPGGNQQPQQNSSSDLSDSDENVASNMLPMTARATPFQHDHSLTTVPPSTSFIHGNTNSMFKKHLSLKGPTMRSVQTRHVSSSATPPPLSYSGHGLVRNEVMTTPSHTHHERRPEDRKRNPGPLQHSSSSQAVKDEDVKLSYSPSFNRLSRSRTELNLSKDYLKILMERVRNNPLL